MLEKNKNLKDNLSPAPPHSIVGMGRGEGWGVFYQKTSKLITALFMVTDILESEEPLRNKLRTLGAEVVTDIHLAHPNVGKKILAIISLLDIGSAINLISEMNCNILKKEFIQLRQSIKEESKQNLMLSDFFEKKETEQEENDSFINNSDKNSVRCIGIQKGNTLLKALKKVELPNKKKVSSNNSPAPYEAAGFRSGFDLLKKQRREEILNIIKEKKSATITDIKNSTKGALVSCGEKTLQRELVSMVADGILKKTGEKRWSRYFL